MIRQLVRRIAFSATVCTLFMLASCSQDSGAAQGVSAQLNQGALEMLNGHASERIVIYHPDSGTGQYTLRLDKHYPCASEPCDAPAGQQQGALLLTVARGKQLPGPLERWVSVPQMFEVTRKDQ